MNYKEINLFEGAMKSILPSAYMDVSLIRPLPDNQEVYGDSDMNGSVIFECNCLESSQTIENISSYCFYDIADVNKVDSSQYTKIYEKGQLSNTYLPNVDNQFPLSYCIGIQPDVRVDENVDAFMLMFIVTIRLSSYSNDIMIIFNIPTNNVNQNITISDICSNEVVKNVLNSFKIIDFSLF